MKKNRTKINRKKLVNSSMANTSTMTMLAAYKKNLLFSIVQFFSSHQTHKLGMTFLFYAKRLYCKGFPVSHKYRRSIFSNQRTTPARSTIFTSHSSIVDNVELFHFRIYNSLVVAIIYENKVP